MDAPKEDKLYRVFLSHGGGDTYIVNDLFGPKVRVSGAEVFVDESQVAHGDDLRERIFRELAICDELLVLLTPSSVKRHGYWPSLARRSCEAYRYWQIRYGVSEDELRALGILSILGTHTLLVPAKHDKYVEQQRSCVEGKRHG